MSREYEPPTLRLVSNGRKSSERRTLSRARTVIAVSETVKRSLIERHELDPDRIHVIHHGVDHERFRPQPNARESFLFYPAHRRPTKNHDRLLEAFAVVRRRRSDLRLVLTGGGARLAGLAARLQAATRVPVEQGNPMHQLQLGHTGLSPEQIAYVEPLAAVPVGLALGAAS